LRAAGRWRGAEARAKSQRDIPPVVEVVGRDLAETLGETAKRHARPQGRRLDALLLVAAETGVDRSQLATLKWPAAEVPLSWLTSHWRASDAV
jgi:hypothetical protein